MSQHQIELQFEVPVNREHAWEFYFNQIAKWWPNEFNRYEKTKKFVFQTFVGGKIYEDFGEGDGFVWGEVIGVDYLKYVTLRGNLIRQFGGPALSFQEISFIAKGEQAQISITIDFIGTVSDATQSEIIEGWEKLFKQYFIPYCLERD